MSFHTETELFINPYRVDVADTLSAILAERGYESFLETENGVKSYIQSSLYKEGVVEEVLALLPIKGYSVTYLNREVEDQDWNSRWVEEGFTPISIGDNCIIHSPKHTIHESCKYDILLAPKMAFGSGHHQTTRMMAEWAISSGINAKSVLDMGCGTGVLAILAAKCGASQVTAIDIDKKAYENTIENAQLNGISIIDVRLGGADKIGNDKFDVLFANINRNILITDMYLYVAALKPGGELYVSGFYQSDIKKVSEEAVKCGFAEVESKICEDWASVKYKISHSV